MTLHEKIRTAVPHIEESERLIRALDLLTPLVSGDRAIITLNLYDITNDEKHTELMSVDADNVVYLIDFLQKCLKRHKATIEDMFPQYPGKPIDKSLVEAKKREY